jgi:amino acid permease
MQNLQNSEVVSYTLCVPNVPFSFTDALVVGNAPGIFLRTPKSGLPYVFCSMFALLPYMGTTSGSGKVFGWFSNMTAVAGLITWFGICVTYIRFHKGYTAQGLDRSKLPYASVLQPYAAWYGAITCLFISLVRSPMCLPPVYPPVYSPTDGPSPPKENGSKTYL